MSAYCDSCRFWSERLAYANGGEPVKAYCFGKGGKHYGKYTFGTQGCDKWKENLYGAIDAPHSEDEDPYADEEQPTPPTSPGMEGEL